MVCAALFRRARGVTPLTDAQKLDILWDERSQRQGVVAFLRLAQVLSAIAVAGLTLYTLLK